MGLVLKPFCGLLGLSWTGAGPFSTSSLDSPSSCLCLRLNCSQYPTMPRSLNASRLCMSYFLPLILGKCYFSHMAPSQVHPCLELSLSPQAEAIPPAVGWQPPPAPHSATAVTTPQCNSLLAFRLCPAPSLGTMTESYLPACASQCSKHGGHRVRFVGLQIPQDFKYLYHFLLSKLDYN